MHDVRASVRERVPLRAAVAHTCVRVHARARARLRSSRIAERTKSRRINVLGGLKDREANQELYRSLFHHMRMHAVDSLQFVAFCDTVWLQNSIFLFKQISG